MTTRWMFERTTVDGKASGIGIAAAFAAILAAIFATGACSRSGLTGNKPKDAAADSPDLAARADSSTYESAIDRTIADSAAESSRDKDTAVDVVTPGVLDVPLPNRDGGDSTGGMDGADGASIRLEVGIDREHDGGLAESPPQACLGTVVLGNRPLPGTGDVPNFVATADLNGDGRPDIVTANRKASTVSVLLGLGKARFAPKVDFACGASPNAVVVVDLEGDRKLDLVTANRDGNTISVLLGAGDGTFAKKVDYAGGAGSASVAVGDVNGDGRPDVVTGNLDSYPGSVSVLLGTGGGKFARKVDFETGGSPEAVALGDLDGDGDLDLATANWDGGGASVLLGKGDGTFAGKVDYVSDQFGPTSVALGDLDRDGKLDLVLLSSSSLASVFLGKGDGTFGAPVAYPVGKQAESDSRDGLYQGFYTQGALALGDADGDGKLDIFTASVVSSTVSVLLGKGDGTVGEKVDYPAGGAPSSLALADLDGDGKADLVTTNSEAGDVTILSGKGGGAFVAADAATYPTGEKQGSEYPPRSIALGDVNSDGTLDIVAPNHDAATISVFCGKGDGTFAKPQDYPVAGPAMSAAVGDLNADGKLDIVCATESGRVSVLYGNGDGTFAAQAGYPTVGGSKAVALGDLNGDGKLDIVIANGGSDGTPSVSVLIAKADGRFASSVEYATPRWTISVALGDLNRDGRLDIVTANMNGNTLSVLLGKGDGTFEPEGTYPTGNSLSVALGDVDRDGDLDLVTPSDNDKAVTVILGSGAGKFETGVNYPTGQWLASVVLVDINGDGDLDIVATNADSDALSVLLGTGGGRFASKRDYATGARGGALAVGDLNGDGRLDAVVAEAGPGAVVVLLGACE